MDTPLYDVVVVGGGAAGLSAALVLGRARRRVAVIDAGSPRNAPAAHMHGFLSRDGLPPAELLAFGRDEVERYGVEIIDGSAVGIVRDSASPFRVALGAGRSVLARQILIATGLRDEIPDIPGLRERWARDVLHCPYCHGYEERDRKLGVLGGSPAAVRYAQIVRQWSDDLAYITPAGSLTATERRELAARGIGIAEGAAQRILVEGDRLRGVELDGERIVACDALFVPPRFVPNSDLLSGARLRTRRGRLAHGRSRRADERRERVGGRQRRRPTRPGHHGRGSRIRSRHRHQRRSRCGRRPQRRPRLPAEQRIRTSTGGAPMSNRPLESQPVSIPPPSKHHLSVMIWLSVFPTLTVINLALGDWLKTLSPVLRTFVLATIAVPIVIYGLMPSMHRARTRLLTSRAAHGTAGSRPC